MSTQITTLPNGLRVVSHQMPHLETVALGLWVATGARHETIEQHGLSHFLEHMAFKGTKRRSARAIVEEIESVGGDLNAATGLDMTAYYARVLKGDEGVALEILADILQNSVFAAEELEREREVILQEIAATLDSPEDIAFDLLHAAAFPGQSVGRPILGTPESVRRFKQGDFKSLLQSSYSADRMVISAAGAIRHDSLVCHAEAKFGALSQASSTGCQQARYEGGAHASEKQFEQSHFVLGFEGPGHGTDDFYVGQVFSGLFGGGMSSRLFQEVREKRGLCYSIYTSSWALDDTGMFWVHAATGREMMTELMGVVAAEFRRAVEAAPMAAEVDRAKAQLKAGLLMGLESSAARAEQMARQLIAYDRLLPSEELIRKVDSVTPHQVQQFAERLCASKSSAVVVGAGRRSYDYANSAHQMFAITG